MKISVKKLMFWLMVAILLNFAYEYFQEMPQYRLAIRDTFAQVFAVTLVVVMGRTD